MVNSRCWHQYIRICRSFLLSRSFEDGSKIELFLNQSGGSTIEGDLKCPSEVKSNPQCFSPPICSRKEELQQFLVRKVTIVTDRRLWLKKNSHKH
ncbi:hypothetical protein AVEN_239751-1 [Araneus ventricosus]|uniref:Uncharacterized protein n=1 Tax=Araneus ventricosus TaxID=182803 RepID=A0A4Y2BJB9_ARAVE|nr:hypothetical protein AVEN_239751-1 [Araneus ventricosus]